MMGGGVDVSDPHLPPQRTHWPGLGLQGGSGCSLPAFVSLDQKPRSGCEGWKSDSQGWGHLATPRLPSLSTHGCLLPGARTLGGHSRLIWPTRTGCVCDFLYPLARAVKIGGDIATSPQVPGQQEGQSCAGRAGGEAAASPQQIREGAGGASAGLVG